MFENLYEICRKQFTSHIFCERKVSSSKNILLHLLPYENRQWSLRSCTVTLQKTGLIRYLLAKTNFALCVGISIMKSMNNIILYYTRLVISI